MSSFDSFTNILSNLSFRLGGRGGGRKAQEPNQDAMDSNSSYMAPCKPSEARLTIVQITDVYTLDHFASLKTMLAEIRAKQGATDQSNRVISMLTGDFLAPYLLSSIDLGAGMMHALANTPIDVLTWGNHEADIPHSAVCRHVKNWPGTWINSNMQSHQAMEYQIPYQVVEIQSPDGSQSRKIGLVAVLSNDPKLYSQFKAPGAFGGAEITDPWETLRKYETLLKEQEGCDLVIPLEHLYMHENEKTCKEFDFPLILSGHDHHRVDQVIHGTRVIKPGMDGVHASVVEIVWERDSPEPMIRSVFVPVDSFEPCPKLKAETNAAYDALLPLRNTQLASILPSFLPLSSKNARGCVCTMGRLVCSMLKTALEQTVGNVDAVILMGGNIRANEDYDSDAFFSLETLEAEIKSNEVIGFVDIPGKVLAEGIEATHAGEPIPGWMQYDDDIKEELIDGTKRVTCVAGKPLEPSRLYRVATKITDLTNGQSGPFTKYFKAHPNALPAKGSYYNIHAELMGFFARGLFSKLWDATSELLPNPEDVLEESCNPQLSLNETESRLRLAALDREGTGIVTVDNIQAALRDFLGLSVVNEVKILAEAIHDCADMTGDQSVSVVDFEKFCESMPKELHLPEKWSGAFPDPVPMLSLETSSASSTSDDDDDSVSSSNFFGKEPSMTRANTEATELIDYDAQE